MKIFFHRFIIQPSILRVPLGDRLLLIGQTSEHKEKNMKSITKTTVLGSALVLLAGLTGIVRGFSPEDQSEAPNVITVDLAVDCRTAAGELIRGGLFILNGKLFPAGTLPSGMASNDPTQPVNGVAPIGEWLVRGHHAFPLPPAIAPAYSSSPGDFGTAYFILDQGRAAIFTETYAFLEGFAPSLAFTAVTGGTGRFAGAAGDAQGGPIGFNVTGCPNFRSNFNIVPGSIRGSNK
jgi:hypothetical protein